MTRPERVTYLRSQGWHRIGYTGAQTWKSPDPGEHYAHYTLAAAIREQLRRDRRAALPHIGGIPVIPHKREETYGRGLDGQPVTHWVIDCPWCGREHTHGAGPGHRVSHCLRGDGYYIDHPAGDEDWA